jgi:hypothetical protein
MPGAVALVVAMLVVLPSALFAAGAIWCALLGASLNSWVKAEDKAPGGGGG